MTASEQKSWEVTKIEYEKALTQFSHYSVLRRQDMVFVTTVQVAILTIIGSKLLTLDFTSSLLSGIAFFVLLLGLNSERRLSAYMAAYMNRATQIEADFGLSLLTSGAKEVNNRRMLLSNATVFSLYYFIFIFVWIFVWAINLFAKHA